MEIVKDKDTQQSELSDWNFGNSKIQRARHTMTTFVDPKFVDVQRQRQRQIQRQKRERMRQTMALFVDPKAVDVLWEVPLEEIPPILGHLPAPEDRHWGGRCSWFGKKTHFEIGNKTENTFWGVKKKYVQNSSLIYFSLSMPSADACEYKKKNRIITII